MIHDKTFIFWFCDRYQSLVVTLLKSCLSIFEFKCLFSFSPFCTLFWLSFVESLSHNQCYPCPNVFVGFLCRILCNLLRVINLFNTLWPWIGFFFPFFPLQTNMIQLPFFLPIHMCYSSKPWLVFYIQTGIGWAWWSIWPH